MKFIGYAVCISFSMLNFVTWLYGQLLTPPLTFLSYNCKSPQSIWLCLSYLSSDGYCSEASLFFLSELCFNFTKILSSKYAFCSKIISNPFCLLLTLVYLARMNFMHDFVLGIVLNWSMMWMVYAQI